MDVVAPIVFFGFSLDLKFLRLSHRKYVLLSVRNSLYVMHMHSFWAHACSRSLWRIFFGYTVYFIYFRIDISAIVSSFRRSDSTVFHFCSLFNILRYFKTLNVACLSKTEFGMSKAPRVDS